MFNVFYLVGWTYIYNTLYPDVGIHISDVCCIFLKFVGNTIGSNSILYRGHIFNRPISNERTKTLDIKTEYTSRAV